jgi:energy-coupling factor transport system permease protein
VLEESLDRAISLAGSMDSRGYGRRATLAPNLRRVANALLLTGLGGALVGSYFIVDPAAKHGMGVIALVAGTAVAVLAALLTGRQVQRTRYRHDPWGSPEWLTIGCAVAVLGCYLLGHPGNSDIIVLQWPSLPLIPLVGTLVAACAGVLTPSPAVAR